MEGNTIIPIEQVPPLTRAERLWKKIYAQKLSNPIVIATLLIVSAGISIAVVKGGLIAGLMAIVGIAVIPILFMFFAYPRMAIIGYLIFAYVIMWFFKLGVNFPLGTLMDGMLLLFVIGLVFKMKGKRDWSVFKSPISTVILIWFSINVLQIANPWAESRMAWVYTIRTVALIMLIYFVFIYYITSTKYIKVILKVWLGLATFGALYGLKQQFIGFFPFEEAYLHSDPTVELLLFIGGVWRKFSIFSDPVAFSYNMVIASLVCIGLSTGVRSKKKKVILICLAVLYQFAMLYSGTRGAYVLLPAGFVMFTILKFNKFLLGLLIAGALAFVVVIFMPTGNGTLMRFQSAFKPSKDASYILRKRNQKRMQPYIQTHPMGGGLGSVGEWGQKFTPNSFLARIPADSGYVRIAGEHGFVGLFIFCTYLFVIIKTGINNYYKIKDRQLKAICLAMVLMVFALNIGNFPQEALVQYPSNVYFYLALALITVTERLDRKNREEEPKAPLY